MFPMCPKCNCILEYNPTSGCLECPDEKYHSAWIEAEYAVLSWQQESIDDR